MESKPIFVMTVVLHYDKISFSLHQITDLGSQRFSLKMNTFNLKKGKNYSYINDVCPANN